MDKPAVPSPFLPGTRIQYAWDATSISYLKQCPRLYQYIMLEGWVSNADSVHLTFGNLFHEAVATYDKLATSGLHHEDAVRQTIRELLVKSAEFDPDQGEKAGKYKNRDSLVRSVVLYLDHRHDDTMRTYILANGKPAVELSFTFELPFGPGSGEVYEQPYMLCGHLDRVCQDPNGDLFDEDHKTTIRTPGQYYFDQYDLDTQMTLYTLAGKVLLNAPIRGVMVNAVQLLLEPPYNRFVRGITYRTADQLEEWIGDLQHWLTMAEWYATNDVWPMNDTACDKYGGCRFRDVCSRSPSVRNIWLKDKFHQLPPEERWNPLKPR